MDVEAQVLRVRDHSESVIPNMVTARKSTNHKVYRQYIIDVEGILYQP